MDSRATRSRNTTQVLVDRYQRLLCRRINQRSSSTRRTEVCRTRRVEGVTSGATMGVHRSCAPELLKLSTTVELGGVRGFLSTTGIRCGRLDDPGRKGAPRVRISGRVSRWTPLQLRRVRFRRRCARTARGLCVASRCQPFCTKSEVVDSQPVELSARGQTSPGRLTT